MDIEIQLMIIISVLQIIISILIIYTKQVVSTWFALGWRIFENYCIDGFTLSVI